MAMKLPKNLTVENIMEVIKEDGYFGFCLACGEQAENIEPDARNYECDVCGKRKVFGAEEILLMMSF